MSASPPRTTDFLVAFADGVTTAITRNPNNDNLIRETFDIASYFCLLFWLQFDTLCFPFKLSLLCVVLFVCEMKESETEACYIECFGVGLMVSSLGVRECVPCHRHLRGSASFKLILHQHVK